VRGRVLAGMRNRLKFSLRFLIWGRAFLSNGMKIKILSLSRYPRKQRSALLHRGTSKEIGNVSILKCFVEPPSSTESVKPGVNYMLCDPIFIPKALMLMNQKYLIS
jgi:hypothetical protein